MNYSFITSDMTWSYSRLTAFDDCPYAFEKKYIVGMDGPKKKQFFSSYGSLMHEVLADRLSGKLPREDMGISFMTGFVGKVEGDTPNPALKDKYYESGKAYLEKFEFPFGEVLAVEKQYSFTLDGNKFVGIVDCVAKDKDGKLVILDHKSHDLKPRSPKKNKASDRELDAYLRQLYLYSIPVKLEFGKYPDFLAFNCFRKGELIIEPFKTEDFLNAQSWALTQIKKINENEVWDATPDFFKCRYLCDCADECPYKDGNTEEEYE